MTTTPTIRDPGGFAPVGAVAFGALGGAATAVDAANPLPTTPVVTPASSTPLIGEASAAVTVGPFAPQLGRPIWLTLSGSWAGGAELLRSTDGGVTRSPLTVGGQPWGAYSANCNEPVLEETVAGATCYLALAPTSGTIAYAVTQ